VNKDDYNNFLSETIASKMDV